MIPELVAYATGIDLLGAWLELAAGRDVDITPHRDEVASIRFLTAPRTGTLTRFEAIDQAQRPASVRQISLSRPLGSEVKPAEDAYDRLGFVIASGPERTQVVRDVDRTLAMIRIHVEAPRPALV
jgi:cysteine synthase A